MMQFASPWFLLGLAMIPVLVWRILRPRRADGGAIRFPQVSALPGGRAPLRPLVAASLPWVRVAAFALLIIALARPQTQASVEKQTTEGIDIMLTMDISTSMLFEDLKPRNRITVARDTLERFALDTENDRLGLVVFARHAFTQCPLTLDHEMVATLVVQAADLIQQVQRGFIEDGTAIGMAIATAAHRLQTSKAKSRVIILMTDGENNAGAIDPITAARAAAALGIKIYAIGVGREGYVQSARGVQYAKVDKETLGKVAKLGNGRYFHAHDAEALARIYADIRRMEKSRFEIAKRRPVVEEFPRYLWPAVILLVAQFLLGATYARRAP